MESINISKLTDNSFESVSKGWVPIAADSKDAFNTVTANWGGISFLWNRPVVYAFIYSEGYTFDFIQNNDYFTLSFLGQENKAMHEMCDSKSGHEVDGIRGTGLKPIIADKGNILFEQGRLNTGCRRMYTNVLKREDFLDPSVCEQRYTTRGSPHHVYVAEITGMRIRE